ncbi:MAG: N-glycosylase/DNA lyase [Candidatus Woesearchaeota archaeon]
MNDLKKRINGLRNSSLRKLVEKRLAEFAGFKHKNSNEWFSELCFCILTANSKARTAMKIQDELGAKGFCSYCASDIKECIIRNKHRFHNNKTKYIVEARKHLDIKNEIITIAKKDGEASARDWLVGNVKGLGYKEASHFLRNTGFFNLAVLDRHILNLMVEYGIIKEKPHSLTRNKYLEIEKKFKSLADSFSMSCAELDLYMWSLKTGEVLK